MTAQGARVLYIDDDEGLRRLVAKALERRGYVVTVAASGAEGVALAAAQTFDLVAVDHYMPGQDGLATVEQLQQMPVPPPIVYVSGSEESRTAVAALKAGAVDYVVKTIGDDFFDLLHNTFIHAIRQVRLRRANEETQAALKASNERLKTLLKEVNHRVANSLQLVSALVRLQAGVVSDENARAALLDTQRRIQAVAQVHRRLYTSEMVEEIEMEDYLAALVEDLQKTYAEGHNCRLTLTAEPLAVATDQAVSLGVIVNELVTNAVKYAYPKGKGEVRIILARDGGEAAILTVEDDGVGMPRAAAPDGTGLGAKVIAAMAQSLKSALVLDPTHSGVRASLRFAPQAATSPA